MRKPRREEDTQGLLCPCCCVSRLPPSTLCILAFSRMCVRFGSSTDASRDSPGAHECRRRQTGEGFRRRLKVQIGEQPERRAKERRAPRPEAPDESETGWGAGRKTNNAVERGKRRGRDRLRADWRWGGSDDCERRRDAAEKVERFAFGIRRRSTNSGVMQMLPRELFLMQTCVTTHTHTQCVPKRPVDKMIKIGSDLNTWVSVSQAEVWKHVCHYEVSFLAFSLSFFLFS